MFSKIFSPKIVPFMCLQATDGNKIRRIRFAFWTTNATITHSEHEILRFFHGNNGYTNAPECHVYTYIALLVSILAMGWIHEKHAARGGIRPLSMPFLLTHFPPCTALGITITKPDGKMSFKEILL